MEKMYRNGMPVKKERQEDEYWYPVYQTVMETTMRMLGTEDVNILYPLVLKEIILFPEELVNPSVLREENLDLKSIPGGRILLQNTSLLEARLQVAHG